MQPVAHAGLLGHEVLAGLHQELQLEAPVEQADRRQVRLAQGHPGDGQSIGGVALARSSRADPLAPRELWGHLAHASAGGHQEARRGCAKAGRALDADDQLGGTAIDPGQQSAMTGRRVGEGAFGLRSPALVDQAGRQAVLVGVDPDRVHRGPFPASIR